MRARLRAILSWGGEGRGVLLQAFAGLSQKRSAGGVLTAFARGAVHRSRYAHALFLVLSRRQQSAGHLWAVLRGMLTRRAYSRHVASARVVIALVKRVLARQLTHEKKCARVQILASIDRARVHGEFRNLHAAGSLLSRTATQAAARLRAASSVEVIQSGLRRVLVKARYGQQLRRKRAVLKIECTVVIQSTFRRALANYRWINVVQGSQAYCARIRSAFTPSHRWQSNAAVVLQAGLRASLQSTHAAGIMQLERSARASCTLQACSRRCRHRMQYCQSVAALIIQAAARRKPLAAAFAASCCTISKFVTATLCRRNHLARHLASTLLRTYVRSVAVRSRWKTMDGAALEKTPAEMCALDTERQEERLRAIQRMQAASRRWLQSQLGQDIMLRSKRTDLIACLAVLCRRRSARQQHSRLVSLTFAQAWIRRSTAMQVYRRVLAARIVQAAARRTVAENRKQVAKAAGSRVSLSARAALARSRHISLRLAAVSMSTALRRCLEHQQARAQIEACSRISAALTLQLACRRAISRTAFVRNATAAWRLGAALRSCAARQGRQRSDDACRGMVRILRAALLRSNHLAQLLAAKRLQAVLRWKQGQRQGCAMQAQARLAFKIASLQAVCRRAAGNASYRRSLSACSLQAFLRRHHACKGMKEKQLSAAVLLTYCLAASVSTRCVVRHSATKLLQAVFRRCSGQEQGSLQMDVVRRGGDVQVLGAFCRRALAREAYCRSLASEMMQAAVRCMLCREVHHRRSSALSIIQATLRRQFQGRSRAVSGAACGSLKRHVKRTLEVRKLADKRSAVIILQAFCRRCAGKSAGERRMQEENLRRLSAEETLQGARRQASCILQAATRRNRARHLRCLSAALHGLQAAVRCTRVRWIFGKELAVRFLQAVVRRVRAQQQRDAVQRSCDMLQRISKAAVAKVAFAAQRAALIRLQGAAISREYAAKIQGVMMLQALLRARQDRLHGADLMSAAHQIEAAADEEKTIVIERDKAVQYLCECILRLVERSWFLGCIKTQRRLASEGLSLYLRRHFDRSRFSESLEEDRVRERVEASEYLGACVDRMLDRCCYIESVMEDRDKAVAVEYLGLCILRMLDAMEFRAASAWRIDLELRREAVRPQEHDTEEFEMRAAQGGGEGEGEGASEGLVELAEHDVPVSGSAEYDAGADVARMRLFPTKNKYASPQRPAHQQRQRTAQEQVLLDIQLGR